MRQLFKLTIIYIFSVDKPKKSAAAKGGSSNPAAAKGKGEGMLIDLGNDSTNTKSNNQVKIKGWKKNYNAHLGKDSNKMWFALLLRRS